MENQNNYNEAKLTLKSFLETKKRLYEITINSNKIELYLFKKAKEFLSKQKENIASIKLKEDEDGEKIFYNETPFFKLTFFEKSKKDDLFGIGFRIKYGSFFLVEKKLIHMQKQ